MVAYESIFTVISKNDVEKMRRILSNFDESDENNLKPFLVNFNAIKRKSKKEKNRVII